MRRGKLERQETPQSWNVMGSELLTVKGSGIERSIKWKRHIGQAKLRLRDLFEQSSGRFAIQVSVRFAFGSRHVGSVTPTRSRSKANFQVLPFPEYRDTRWWAESRPSVQMSVGGKSGSGSASVSSAGKTASVNHVGGAILSTARS